MRAPLVEAVKTRETLITDLQARGVQRQQETAELKPTLATTNARLARLEALLEGKK